jgi:cell division septation protein DedD
MSDGLKYVRDPFRISERRLHVRHRISLVYIEFGEENGSTVLDISECGVAVYTPASVIATHLPKVRFKFPQSNNWFAASGRIVWATESKKVVGLEFVGLNDEAREQVRKWINSAISTEGIQKESASLEETERLTEAPVAPEPANVMPILESEIERAAFRNQSRHSIATNLVGVARRADSKDGEAVPPSFSTKSIRPVAGNLNHPTSPDALFSEERRYNCEVVNYERTGLLHKALQRSGLPLAAVLSFAMIVFCYHSQSTGNNRQARAVTAAGKVPAVLVGRSVNSENPTVNPKLPLDTRHFALQVGAMRHRENADVLAELLRRRNFSVFVFKRSTDSLYRVIVGPFSDADSTLRVKEALQKQGFETIRANSFVLAQPEMTKPDFWQADTRKSTSF